MEAKANELIFISRIKRDGTGVHKVTKKHLKFLLEHPIQKEEEFILRRLSLTEDTYIASGFNSYVVKLKPPTDDIK